MTKHLVDHRLVHRQMGPGDVDSSHVDYIHRAYRPFECVLMDSPGLARVTDSPDPASFGARLSQAEEEKKNVAVFNNLGGWVGPQVNIGMPPAGLHVLRVCMLCLLS